MSMLSFTSLFLLFVIVPGSYQWKMTNMEKYLYSKPIVVPASEGDYHYVMIEVDTMATGGKRAPLRAKIGVILLDGEFTFSGIEERWFSLLKKDSSGTRHCHPFLGINTVNKCEDEYFLLNADFVNIKKTTMERAVELETICRSLNQVPIAKDVESEIEKDHKFVIRFGKRVLMAYKKGSNFEKCIGTYDTEDDQLTCIEPYQKAEGQPHVLRASRFSNFLYNEDGTERKREAGSVEIFCKEPHTFKKN